VKLKFGSGVGVSFFCRAVATNVPIGMLPMSMTHIRSVLVAHHADVM
jgi:hypothetical protein